MTSDDIIAVWKGQAGCATLTEQQLATMPGNPAGLSPFDREPAPLGAGGMLPITIRTIGQITSLMSCTFACSETMWDGSCDFFSYGCCG
jgi:mersacidin/lichenicidin family type 2 lantibiotic